MKKENLEKGKGIEKRIANLERIATADYIIRSAIGSSSLYELAVGSGGVDAMFTQDVLKMNHIIDSLVKVAISDARKRLEKEFEEL